MSIYYPLTDSYSDVSMWGVYGLIFKTCGTESGWKIQGYYECDDSVMEGLWFSNNPFIFEFITVITNLYGTTNCCQG